MITLRQLSEVWEQVLRETPVAPAAVFYEWLTGRRMTYRQRLDEPRYNYRAEMIPRIVLVRRNLRVLGKPARKPRLPA